jgi:integrase/recombinase XerD
MTSLRTRMTEDMQIRNLAVHTQNTYLLQVALFARHFNKSPELLGPEQIRTYQVYLTAQRCPPRLAGTVRVIDFR